MAGAGFPLGDTFYTYVAQGRSVNIPLLSGGNVIGRLVGYDGLFVYVQTGTKSVEAVPASAFANASISV